MSKGKAKWKLEQWFDVFPKNRTLWQSLEKLGGRELVIVATSMLDVGLAHLLSKRLQGETSHVIDFLGANGNSKAPASTFSSRIDLAYHVGLLQETARANLHTLRSLRNLMAHHVNMGFMHEDAQTLIGRLNKHWISHLDAYCKTYPAEETSATLLKHANTIKPHLPTHELACAYQVMILVDMFSKSFEYMTGFVEPVGMLEKTIPVKAEIPPPPATSGVTS